MKNFLSIMLPAGGIGIAIALFADDAGFYVNQMGIIAVMLAIGLLAWIVWHGVPAANVTWPDDRTARERKSVSVWALESLIADALRGSQSPLRTLALMLDDLADGREDLSPGLTEFIDAARSAQPVPRISRRTLQSFLKEIVS